MTSLTLVRRIRARPGIVFEALTTAEGIAQWWGPDAGPVLAAQMEARIGGRYRVRFRMLDGTEHESSGEIVELAPPRRLAMTWRWLAGGDDPGESMLSFDLCAVDDGTELTLTHAKLHDAQTQRSHTEGWSGALDKLEKMFV